MVMLDADAILRYLLNDNENMATEVGNRIIVKIDGCINKSQYEI